MLVPMTFLLQTAPKRLKAGTDDALGGGACARGLTKPVTCSPSLLASTVASELATYLAGETTRLSFSFFVSIRYV